MKRIVNDYIHYIQDSLSIGDQRSFVKFVNCIHPIHATAMVNKKRGLEGKFARQYVNRDVTSLLLHVPVT